MKSAFTPIAQLDPAGLDRLALLHQAVMHTLLAELGLPVVRRYYEVCREDPAVIGFCALTPAGEMLGWAAGSPHPDEINARLRQPLPWFAGQLLRLAFTRPGILRQLAVSAFSARAPLEPGAIELTYIGVAPDARGQGAGTGLLAAFIQSSRSAGYRSVVLSVETDNPGAVALYTRAGFTITRTFTEGHFQRHRMQLVC